MIVHVHVLYIHVSHCQSIALHLALHIQKKILQASKWRWRKCVSHKCVCTCGIWRSSRTSLGLSWWCRRAALRAYSISSLWYKMCHSACRQYESHAAEAWTYLYVYVRVARSVGWLYRVIISVYQHKTPKLALRCYLHPVYFWHEKTTIK